METGGKHTVMYHTTQVVPTCVYLWLLATLFGQELRALAFTLIEIKFERNYCRREFFTVWPPNASQCNFCCLPLVMNCSMHRSIQMAFLQLASLYLRTLVINLWLRLATYMYESLSVRKLNLHLCLARALKTHSLINSLYLIDAHVKLNAPYLINAPAKNRTKQFNQILNPINASPNNNNNNNNNKKQWNI